MEARDIVKFVHKQGWIATSVDALKVETLSPFKLTSQTGLAITHCGEGLWLATKPLGAAMIG